MSQLIHALDSFRCYKNEDIETFLRTKALDFLERKWCAVYLILDEEAFDSGSIEIAAYFTLSHKALIPENVTKSKVKALSGFKDSEVVHTVLIGQLGKYMSEDITYDISAAAILDCAMEVIKASSDLIPCRCVLVETSEDVKVQKVYKDCGFNFLQHNEGQYQYYKRID